MIVIDEDICRWVVERTGGTYYTGSGVGIGLIKDGKVVAGVLYDDWNGRSVRMHVASDGSKRWLNREFLACGFSYPFNQLKVNKLLGLVDSTNTEALNFDYHLGFVTEAIIEGAGKHGDLIVLSMTRPQCRFLRS